MELRVWKVLTSPPEGGASPALDFPPFPLGIIYFEQKVRVFLYYGALAASDETSTKHGTSLNEGKGVRSDVSLKWCPESKLDQRVRWTCREEDAKEAKLVGASSVPGPYHFHLPVDPFRRPSLGRSLGTLPSSQTPFLSRACPTRAPGDAIRVHFVVNTFSKPRRGEKENRIILLILDNECSGEDGVAMV